LHSIPQIHPYYNMYQNFFTFKSSMVTHGTYMPHFLSIHS
jgi:hypothetical protein